MASQTRFAEIASLAGDPARCSMLHALMGGRAHTASELARAAHVTPQTASGHLARMVVAGLLVAETQGRHRYHRLASREVASMLESIMLVASSAAPPLVAIRTGPRDAAMRAARTCYDHLAGRLAVALAEGLVDAGYLELTHEAGVVTPAGIAFFQSLGIPLVHDGARPGRVMCRPCLDWSERRPHLAGALGAAICSHSVQRGWVRRSDGTRTVTLTPEGHRIFREQFGAKLDPAFRAAA